MKKKLTVFVLVCVAVLALAGLVACGGAGSGGNGVKGSENSSASSSESSSEISTASSSASAMSTGGGIGVKDSVDAYSWDELSEISQEIGEAESEEAAIEIAKKYNLCTSDGKLDGTQVKNVTLSDGTTTQVQIAGFAHDYRSYGTGKAGITFIFKDAVAEHAMNSTRTSEGGWEKSEMRDWLNSDFKGQLPQDLLVVIVPVDKSTNNKGKTKYVSSVTATSDELWLCSGRELCGQVDGQVIDDRNNQAHNDVLNAEGEEYKLFRDMNVDTASGNAILTKTFKGDSCDWWKRSPSPRYSGAFNAVDSDGDPNSGYDANRSNAVVPGFCI